MSSLDALPAANLLPDDDDVAFYDEHGWWVSERIIPDEVLDAAQAAVDAFYRHGGDPLAISSGYSNWTPSDGMDVLRNNEFVSLQSPGLAALACFEMIGACAARLARTDEIRLLDDQLIWKPGRSDQPTGAVGWHADKAYWATCSSDRLLTAWIPFHDVDEERGTLSVIDGSHRWPDNQHLRLFNDGDLDAVAARLAADGRTVREVPFRLARGQVSFHHGWTVHASHANRSSEPRLAFAVHLQDGSNEYVPYARPDGTEVHMVDELLCRRRADGTPDFSDPAVFPRVWPVD